MPETLKVRKVGNSSGVILPKGFLEEMDVEEGDGLFAIREADGSLRLTPYDPGVVVQGKSSEKKRPLATIAVPAPGFKPVQVAA